MSEIAQPRSYGVDEITYYIKEYLAEDSFLAALAVEGEAVGVKAHSSGHVYLTLKGADSSMKVVMFRRFAAAQRWLPRDGERVVAVGNVSLFERDSAVQLYAELLLPAGSGPGDAARRLAELKQRLEAEGLFSPQRKRPLPPWPENIGVITAADSAAWADIRRIARARHPGVKLRLYPTLVQGEAAPAAISAALAKADQGGHQVLLLARGGGAEADLAAFQTEAVVRAIAACRTPLISAVGHESDFTLADLAADVRAATPTHGAQLAVLDSAALAERLSELRRRYDAAARRQLDLSLERVDRLAAAWRSAHPRQRLEQTAQRIAQLESALSAAAARQLERSQQRLALDARRLALLDPLAVLQRGYALVQDEQGAVVSDAARAAVGQQVTARLAQGALDCEIIAIHQEESHG